MKSINTYCFCTLNVTKVGHHFHPCSKVIHIVHDCPNLLTGCCSLINKVPLRIIFVDLYACVSRVMQTSCIHSPWLTAVSSRDQSYYLKPHSQDHLRQELISANPDLHFLPASSYLPCLLMFFQWQQVGCKHWELTAKGYQVHRCALVTKMSIHAQIPQYLINAQ